MPVLIRHKKLSRYLLILIFVVIITKDLNQQLRLLPKLVLLLKVGTEAWYLGRKLA